MVRSLLNKSYLRYTCIPQKLVNLIMNCISILGWLSSHCEYGELSDSFTRGRAIRQGDTLFRLPIFLCYSWKNYHNGIPFLPLIMVSVSLSLLENMSIVTTTHVFPTSFFADDLFLFSEASVQQASILKQCMDIFCRLYLDQGCKRRKMTETFSALWDVF